MQALVALPAPENSIWHYPGFPSLLVTYDVANDYFFSGHTAIAVLGATELARLGKSWVTGLAVLIVVFEVATVLVLRAHYTMDVFTGAIAALYVASLVSRISPPIDRLLGHFPAQELRNRRSHECIPGHRNIPTPEPAERRPGEFVLGGPRHRWNIDTLGGRIEHYFMPAGAVVDDDVTPPRDTHQELLQSAMGVFPANVFAGHVENQEIAFHLEGHLALGLTETEAASKVLGAGETINRSFTQRRCVPNLFDPRGRFRSRIHVPDNPRRIASQFRMRRRIVRHYRARTDHRHFSDDDSRSERRISPNGGSTLDHRTRILGEVLFAARETVIGERGVRPDEHVVFHP